MEPRLSAHVDLSPERIGRMHLAELDRHIRERAAAGTPLQVEGPESTVRESADGTTTEVRESVSVSDLPGLMANMLYRTMVEWFSQYQGAWQTYSHEEQVVDYRPNVWYIAGELEDAQEIRQERDYVDSGVMDKTTTFQLKKWGRMFSVPYQVIENDNKGFFRQMPQRMTRSAERTIAKIVVRGTLNGVATGGGLEANPNAYDGLPIFSASRASAQAGGLSGNLVTGAGSALSSANLQAGIAAVNTFLGDADLNPSNVPLNVPARYLVVPPALAMQAAQILNSTVLIAAGTANPITVQGNQNPLRQTILQPILELVVERYLTNQTAYYLLPEADRGPLMIITRQGRGMRPRLMKNIPQRQSIGGGGADDYLLTVDDQVYIWNFDLNSAPYIPFSAIKFAGA